MKTVVIILGFLLFTSGVYGQKITGVCIDVNSGNPVEYVMIGLDGINYGVVSDSQGNFEIDLPDKYNKEMLVFSHISYESYSVDVNSLKTQYAETQNNGEVFKIEMAENAIAIEPVVVKGYELKLVYLNKLGYEIPDIYAHHIVPWPYEYDDQPTTGLQLGVNSGLLVEVDDDTWIREVEFEVLKNTFPTMIFRLSIYKVENDKYTPLMSAPYYMNLDYHDNRQKYKYDISKYNIRADGLVYISFEMVHYDEENEADSGMGLRAMNRKKIKAGKVKDLQFPLYDGKSYYRNMSTGIIMEQDKTIGLRVKGTTAKKDNGESR